MTNAQISKLWVAVSTNQTAVNADAETVRQLAGVVAELERAGLEAPTEIVLALRDAVQVLRNSAQAYSYSVEAADTATVNAA